MAIANSERSIAVSREEYSLAYMPSLDVLRFFAVFIVIISHWFPPSHFLNKYTPNGVFGVIIFFVISGFLITRILLRYRHIAMDQNSKRSGMLRKFYVRRILRIFPVYYITLLLVCLLQIDHVVNVLPWHIFYLSNIYMFVNNQWTVASHLWSLSVEEQFYLVWPFLILYLPEKLLKKFIIACIFIAPLFRAVVFLARPSPFTYILTPSCMDSLGMGALLALLSMKDGFSVKKYLKYIGPLLLIISTGFIALRIQYKNEFYMHLIPVALSYLFYAIVSLVLVAWAANGFSGLHVFLAKNKLLIYLGRISYSMYLFHNFEFDIANKFNLNAPTNLYLKNILAFAILVIASSLSWYIIEKPISKFKKRHLNPT